MTDTAAESLSFNPDAIFKQAVAQADQIQKQIEYQRNIRLMAAAKIRDLNEELAKTNRIVSAMTPRSRTPKPAAEKKPAAAKKPVAKKPAENA
jgi:hypothetical protein